MNPFLILGDHNGQTTEVILAPDCCRTIKLAAAVPREITVPMEAKRVLFSATADVWVRYGGPAVLPVNDILDDTAPELNPAARGIEGIGTLGLVSASPCLVSLAFYR